MITSITTRRGSWNPDSPRFGPDETSVRWDCDGCDFSGEWDDHPYRADGLPHADPEEGQEAYCKECRDKREEGDE